MHNPVKLVSILLILLLLCSCGKNSTKIKINTKEYSGTGYKMTLEIPEIQDDSPAATQFNSDYLTLADNLLNEFLVESEHSPAKEDTLTLTQDIKLNKNKIISIIGHCEAYTGGTYKTQSRIVKNIDLQTGETISLTSLFNDKSYVDRINSYISTLLQTNPEQFSELWKTPTISENQEFYLTSDSIVIFYPPYELSYYSKGFVEIEIPYEEIESYLNSKYAETIFK